MKIIAIDTSCDDTSVAVVEKKNNKIEIISNIVSSQIKIHALYGGVYPMLAKREHQRNLPLVLIKALQQARFLRPTSLPQAKKQSKNIAIRADRHKWLQNYKANKIKVLNKILERDPILLEKTAKFLFKYQKPEVDAIAITNGPGLEPCLWQGVNFAKALAFWWDLPLIPVNHIKAHLAANWLCKLPSYLQCFASSSATLTPKFPAIGLVASGGHTELIYMKKQGDYKLIGSTRDDAAGECFDKTARILGLPYPGGPAIAAEATNRGQTSVSNRGLPSVKLPRPMINSDNYDFSFSGLKTAALYDFQKYKIAMAKEIQQAIIDVLIYKTLKAAKNFNAKSIITGGGVASNKNLRQQFKVQSAKLKVNFFVPEKKLCLDNAAMVGACALLDKSKSTSWQKIKVSGNLSI